MSSQSPYWIWDERRKDFYHADWNPRTGAHDYIWSNNVSSASAPRTVATPVISNPTYPASSGGPPPALPPAQPLEPYGANIKYSQGVSNRAGNQYSYGQSHRSDPNALANSFGQLSTSGHGGYSQSFALPPRTSSITQVPSRREQPTVYHNSKPRGYSTSHASASRPPVSFGSTSAFPPESSRAAGKRAASDYDVTSAPANVLDPVPRFGREVMPKDMYASHFDSATAGSRYGSSLDAQTSTGSYRNYDRTAASTMGSGTKISQVKPESSKGTTKLNPTEFYVRDRPRDFFIEGKVFIKLHTEDAGSTGDHSSFGFSTVAYEELAYSQLRRFVVVKPSPKEYYCLCVPITTYGGKGAAKKSIDKNAHAIIYTGSSAPEQLQGEQGMNKSPLRVLPVRPDAKLDTRSRVNLGKIYSVEWNTKVKEIGRLDKASLVKLISYWKALMNGKPS